MNFRQVSRLPRFSTLAVSYLVNLVAGGVGCLWNHCLNLSGYLVPFYSENWPCVRFLSHYFSRPKSIFLCELCAPCCAHSYFPPPVSCTVGSCLMPRTSPRSVCLHLPPSRLCYGFLAVSIYSLALFPAAGQGCLCRGV